MHNAIRQNSGATCSAASVYGDESAQKKMVDMHIQLRAVASGQAGGKITFSRLFMEALG
jgi:hypothetical protein